MTVACRVLLGGSGRGETLVLDEPVSFWGGVDPVSGRVLDGHHPQAGTSISGRVLVLPHGRGSSSSPSVLAEMIRTGTAPAAILLGVADSVVLLGALVAKELYSQTIPVAVVEEGRVPDGRMAEIDVQGNVKIL